MSSKSVKPGWAREDPRTAQAWRHALIDGEGATKLAWSLLVCSVTSIYPIPSARGSIRRRLGAPDSARAQGER